MAGQGRIGADGMALWFTAQPSTLGPVFGANDYWTGMGLFFDSFDNDGQVRAQIKFKFARAIQI